MQPPRAVFAAVRAFNVTLPAVPTPVTVATAAPPIFLPALLAQCLAYPLLARGLKLQGTPRKAAWILTTIASALMTAASLPFVADYVRGGVARVQPRPVLAYAVNRFFQVRFCLLYFPSI